MIARMKNHAGEPVVLQRGEAIPDNMGNPIVHGRVLGRETGIIVFCLGTCVPFFPLIFFYFIFFFGGYHLFMRIVYKIKLSKYPCNGDYDNFIKYVLLPYFLITAFILLYYHQETILVIKAILKSNYII